MTPAIFYHPEAYSTNGPQLMGRNAAGKSFLRGFLQHRSTEGFCIVVDDRAAVPIFEQEFGEYIADAKFSVVSKENLDQLKSKVVYYPGPQLAHHAWAREHFGSKTWSLCGITHTTSSAAAMDSIVNLFTAPIQPWDTLICTSEAVKSNVANILDAQKHFLTRRLKATNFVLPQMPVIPIGIECDMFEVTDEQSEISRRRLGLDSDTLAVLYMGRLSFHAKAHPLPMYQALEAAAVKTRKKVVLIECGWFANEPVERAFTDAALMMCPSVTVVRLNGRDPDQRRLAWTSADIFCSFADNIQETFGITPIEAMAAGIPLVVSDWDGYKDTVTDGREGYRVPTCMAPPGAGQDLAFRHSIGLDSYDRYCGYTSSFVAVDVGKAIDAFVALFESKDLRNSMAAAGVATARSRFDWRVVIPQYEELWKEMTEIRNNVEAIDSLIDPEPARLEPFGAFSAYPTNVLSRESEVRLRSGSLATALDDLAQIKSLAMINFADSVTPSAEDAGQVLSLLTNGVKTVGEIERMTPQSMDYSCHRCLVWLAKVGLLEIR